MKEIINKTYVTGIIGLAKNTGKTTTINAILELYKNDIIGLTSIGLDGEDIDQLNYLPKPKIMVKHGMIIATACGCLEACDIEFDLLEKTDLQTSLGSVSIIKVLSNGNMVIAGPTTNKELGILISKMKGYTKRIFIDGAFNRMTFANIDNIDAIILATGAAVGPLMQNTIEQTKVVVESFSLPKTPYYAEVPQEALIIKTKDKLYKFYDKRTEVLHNAIIRCKSPIKHLYLNGAITPRIVSLLVKNKIRNITLICNDPTKLLILEREFSHLKKLNIQINIIKPCPLLFVTINPFSPIGYHYDAEEFLNAMKKAIDIPVYNVKKKELKDV